jgi:hypothetical protein
MVMLTCRALLSRRALAGPLQTSFGPINGRSRLKRKSTFQNMVMFCWLAMYYNSTIISIFASHHGNVTIAELEVLQWRLP